jgi:hypothetical protein
MALVKLNNNGVKNATAFGSITGLGNLILIKKQTASGSASISFVDGASSVVLDNTYKEYIFYFNNIHPATNSANLQFQASTNTGSSYGIAITSSYFQAQHAEDDSEAALEYDSGSDLAQSTNFQTILGKEVGNGNDNSTSGFMHLFDPSNTTFVKHFISRGNCLDAGPMTRDGYASGYVNTISAIDAIQFKMSSGNMDAGTISLYGVV